MRISAKAAASVAAAVLLLGLVSLLAYLGGDVDAPRVEHAQLTLFRLEVANTDLERNVLQARAGVLRTYDPINAALEALRREAEALEGDHVDAAGLAALRGALAEQEELVESFKTDNALLQNSLAYFGEVSSRLGAGADETVSGSRAERADGALGSAVSTLATAMLRLTLDADLPAVLTVDTALRRLSALPVRDEQREIVGGLVKHGALLRGVLPETQRLLTALHHIPVETRLAALRDALHRQQTSDTRAAARYRHGLFALSVVLVGLLAALLRQLGRHLRALHRRVAFERTIRTLAARLVAVGPAELPSALGQGLRDLGRLIGAERAYAVGAALPEPIRWTQDARASWPPRWPAEAPSLAASLDADRDGAVFLSGGRQRVRPLAANLDVSPRGWVCLSENHFRPERLTIGFEALRRPLDLWSAEVGLLQVALSPLNEAVERVRLLSERETLEKQLQRARRMETVGAVTSGIAHNFNNIIGAILGYAEMESDGPSPHYAANILGISVAAERGRDLIDQILNFGRRQSGWALRIEMDTLLRETVSLLAVSLPSDVEIRLGAVPAGAIVAGNHAELQQVILNIGRNAAQAMQSGHKAIDVTTQIVRLERPRRPREGTLSRGVYVVVTVADCGRGMDARTLERLFEPFFTTRPTGNGLGLATVREIVGSHGGGIDVASTPGKGSVFKVWLPLAQDALAPSGPDAASRRQGNGETVLVVAPEQSMLYRWEELVAALGYEPVGLHGQASQVGAFCGRFPGRFDAALILPSDRAGGAVQSAMEVRRVLPDVPLLLAADADDVSPDVLSALGSVAIVPRTAPSAELARALRQQLGKARAASPRPPSRTSLTEQS